MDLVNYGRWISTKFRSSQSEVFLRKGVLKIYSKFTGEHSFRSVTSFKLQTNFIESALRHGCSPKNLLQISKTAFPRNTSGQLLQKVFRNVARIEALGEGILIFRFKISFLTFFTRAVLKLKVLTFISGKNSLTFLIFSKYQIENYCCLNLEC